MQKLTALSAECLHSSSSSASMYIKCMLIGNKMCNKNVPSIPQGSKIERYLLFEEDWEEVLCCSHCCLIRVGYQYILIHLKKYKKKKRTWAQTKIEFMNYLFVCLWTAFISQFALLPYHNLRKCPCRWGDGPHTGSAAGPELSPFGCTSALLPHLSCSA